jgi:hypothetical protein
VLQLDDLERRTHTSILVAGMAHAAGAEKVEFPDWDKVRAEFDAWLVAEPVELATDDKTIMLRALGLR